SKPTGNRLTSASSIFEKCLVNAILIFLAASGNAATAAVGSGNAANGTAAKEPIRLARLSGYILAEKQGHDGHTDGAYWRVL
ncbi:MAG: hypothetical protein ACFNM6_08760, partial [Prevotella sp.]